MSVEPSTFNHLTHVILGSAIAVHRTLGPGLLESTYQQCLQIELASHSLRFVVQHAVPIVCKGIALDASYRIDLIVEDLVVVEVKSVADGVKRLINPRWDGGQHGSEEDQSRGGRRISHRGAEQQRTLCVSVALLCTRSLRVLCCLPPTGGPRTGLLDCGR